MLKSKKNDPQSSYKAAELAERTASIHRSMIYKALKKKPLQTGYELERYLKYKLTNQQIMRRLSEFAVRGDIRTCKTGLPRCRVVEWSI